MSRCLPISSATPPYRKPAEHAARGARRRHLATCAEFGPRFLHSTGQAYKGGPDSGVFLQITADDDKISAVPGQKASFGVIKAAQARGDFSVLTERGRRALRVHLKGDLTSGLKMLDAAIAEALNDGIGNAALAFGHLSLGERSGEPFRDPGEGLWSNDRAYPLAQLSPWERERAAAHVYFNPIHQR